MIKRIISFIVVVCVFVGCAQQNVECEVCGEFNLINLSKNEVTSLENEEVSLSRNLRINAQNGSDFFTIWSWNQTDPDASWTASLQKEIRIERSNLVINESGTWTWEIHSAETYESIAYFGGDYYEVQREFKESGTWEYVYGNDQFITLNRDEMSINDQVVIRDKQRNNAIIEQFPVSEKTIMPLKSDGRRFEIVNDVLTNNIILKTIDDDDEQIVKSIDNTSYSLTEGNVLVTVSKSQNLPQLAVKMKAF